MTAGGKRPGAGRKPSPDTRKIAVTKKLDVEIVAYLKDCENATQVIESCIRNSKAFKDWVKSK
jgi:hypothetical protein